MMEKLIAWKADPQRKPLLLKGVRQVGKTTLLLEFGKKYFSGVHYLNFEKEPQIASIFEPDLVPTRILSDLAFFLEKPIRPGEDLVIFDEIQEAPRALTSLKYFREECPNLHLCAAGSLLGLSLGSSSFPVGKVDFETLRPMSFEEFLTAQNDKSLPYFKNITSNSAIPSAVHEHLLQELKHYFVVGGLPEAVSTYCQHKGDITEAFSLVRKKQSDLLLSYYADIAKHAGKVNAMHINRVFQSVPAQMSHAQDGSIRRFKFKGVVPGISHYDRLAGAIDWLEATGMILKIPIVESALVPFQAYAKENCFKLLVFDVGMLGLMTSLSPKAILDGDYGSYKGYFVENFVAQELLLRTTPLLYSWQEGNAEIEFLLEIGGKAVPVEVKSGTLTKAKSLQSFREKYRPPLQIILSSKRLNIGNKNAVQYCPLYFTDRFFGKPNPTRR